MDSIKFQESDHTYQTEEGKPVLSVTRVLPDIPEHLLYKQFFIEKTLLGTRVHRYAEAFNKTLMGIDEAMYDDQVEVREQDEPYIEAYHKFVNDEVVKIHQSETKVYHPGYDYAGTLDIITLTRSRGVLLIDIKCTSVISPAAALQTAAYLKAYNLRRKDKVWKRAVVQLRPDGTYNIKMFPVKNLKYDFEIFLCKLKSAQWDAENLRS
jgi:hypothetical protein